MLGIFLGTQRNTASERMSDSGKKTKVACVDDHRIILSRMLKHVEELLPNAEVVGFENAESALAFAEESGCDILFTEIELYGAPAGLDMARRMQGINPRLNIIFTTVCSQKEYADEVMRLRPSGYLTKVVTKGDVKEALQNLLYEIN